jgi:hypothetical protein
VTPRPYSSAASRRAATTFGGSDELTVAPPSITISVVPVGEVCTTITRSGRTKFVPPRLFTSTRRANACSLSLRRHANPAAGRAHDERSRETKDHTQLEIAREQASQMTVLLLGSL